MTTDLLTDITTLVAVQSLFRRGPRDPWAPELAGWLADGYVYSDRLRYVLPLPGSSRPGDLPERPELILRLEDNTEEFVSPEPYRTDQVPMLKDKYLLGVFDRFVKWASNNGVTLRRWMELHNQPWVIEGHVARVARPYVFPVEQLASERRISEIAHQLGLAESHLLYAFDVILRYPLYGELAGPSAYYRHHPVRDAFPLPTQKNEPATPPRVCVSFAESIREMVGRLSMDQYLGVLRDLRAIVRESGLHELPPGEVDRDVIRRIAAKVQLTPYLRGFTKCGPIAGGIIGGFGTIPGCGPYFAAAGSAVSISTGIWSGRLPRAAARVRWLQWALRWKIEDEVEHRT